MNKKGVVYILTNIEKKGSEKKIMELKLTLKAARANIGLTLKEAAKEFGIHHETLKNYENDSTNVPRTFFIQIENIYGIPLENIYFGKLDLFLADRANARQRKAAQCI